jgi:pyruvate dehydrogenase E2 component (dihydrolipoamide acetyltransferase)
MAVEIVMPRLSDSMEEGTILKWLKDDGEPVARGEPLAEIETDKATLTYEADAAGVLTIVAAAGETHPIGTVIARLDANGAGPAPPPAADAEPEPEPERLGAAALAPAPSPGAPPPVQRAGGRVKASPVARRIAKERGVDLHQITGTGPGGRIVRADVEVSEPAVAPPPPPPAPAAPDIAAAPEPEPEPAPAPAPAPPPAVTRAEPGAAKGEVTVQELTRTQQLIARRMAESKATIPDFTLRSEVDMEDAVALRTQLRALGGEVPSYNDMIVKACALALREFPRANGSYRDGRFELHSRVNVGVAVAAPGALVVPTIFDADAKSLREIARETRALAERVRAGTVTPPELSGGTFTVSNLGMYGVTDFTAVINPPQAAILSVGALGPRAVVRDGELIARHTMAITLACDHRILYGADAAEFLARIRALLEQPLALAF